MKTRTIWFVIAKFYLLLKALFRSKSSLLYLIILVVLIQLFFLVMLTAKVNRMDEEMTEFRSQSVSTLNRIYTQVWLLNSKEE